MTMSCKLDQCITLISLLTQPDKGFPSLLMDFGHLAHLVSLFPIIFLVDAGGIDP